MQHLGPERIRAIEEEVQSCLPAEYGPLALLARGGMSLVFLTEHRHLGMRAIKVFPAGVAHAEETFLRARLEGRILARLQHPGIRQSFEFLEGRKDVRAFAILQYIDGSDLRQWSMGDRSLTQKVQVLLQVTRALEAAHNHGVLHRDIKPQNILVDPNGRAFLCDFGIALDSEDSKVTRFEDRTPCTVQYASPEQLAGETVDERSDIYSLGAVFYETVYGVRFRRGLAVEGTGTTRAHPVPTDLTSLILRMLEEPSEKRPRSCAEVHGVLREFDPALAQATTLDADPALLPGGHRIGGRSGPGPRLLMWTFGCGNAGRWHWGGGVALVAAATIATIGLVRLFSEGGETTDASHGMITERISPPTSSGTTSDSLAFSIMGQGEAGEILELPPSYVEMESTMANRRPVMDEDLDLGLDPDLPPDRDGGFDMDDAGGPGAEVKNVPKGMADLDSAPPASRRESAEEERPASSSTPDLRDRERRYVLFTEYRNPGDLFLMVEPRVRVLRNGEVVLDQPWGPGLIIPASPGDKVQVEPTHPGYVFDPPRADLKAARGDTLHYVFEFKATSSWGTPGRLVPPVDVAHAKGT